MPAVAIAAIGAGIAAYGTAKTISAQKKAAKFEKQKFAYEKQLSQNRTVRERRDAIRAARMTGGQIAQAAENQGASSTSAALGSQGSIESQLASNLSFLDTQSGLSIRAGEAGSAANSARTAASNAAAIGSLGMQIFQSSGSLAKTFGGKK